MQVFNRIATGELAGSTTAIQLPDIKCRMVWFKAQFDNSGNVYLGGSGVTKAGGDTDITTGYQLAKGESVGPLQVSNLNLFWRISDNAGDDLTYLAIG